MKISALPLEALLYKLRQGFNDNLRSVATSTYGVKPYVIEFPTDIYQANTKTFILGQVPPDAIDMIGVTGATKMTMFVQQIDNANYEKPRDFSGVVRVGLDVHLGWLSSDLRQNFEAMTLATEDAVAETIQPYSVQNWGAGVIYNGAFSAVRGVVEVPEKGQGDLRQLIAFRFGFQIDV